MTEAKRPVVAERSGFPDRHLKTAERTEKAHASRATTRKSPQ